MKNEIMILSLDDLDVLELEERLEMTLVPIGAAAADDAAQCGIRCSDFTCNEFRRG